jgi:hypothetical protein
MQDIGQHHIDDTMQTQDDSCSEDMDHPLDANNKPTTRIPEWVHSTTPPEPAASTQWNKLRPDALIVNKKTRSPKNRKVDIVEIKYCRDTDRAPQTLKATTQHQKLTEMLIKAGYTPENIKLHIITLGVTGTIYKDLLPTLEHLGVQPEQANICVKRLHLHAVQYVKKIATTKWTNENCQKNKTGVG